MNNFDKIKLPKTYKKQIHKALSYYPELSNENIHFFLTKSKLPYYSYISIFSLLNPFIKRVYLIGISTQSTKIRENTLLKNLSFDAQVGALGHELSHALYSSRKSFISLIIYGILYIFPKYRTKFEKETDMNAIKHGLGKYIYQWAREVYPTKKKDGNRYKTYYSPNEILEIIKNYSQQKI